MISLQIRYLFFIFLILSYYYKISTFQDYFKKKDDWDGPVIKIDSRNPWLIPGTLPTSKWKVREEDFLFVRITFTQWYWELTTKSLLCCVIWIIMEVFCDRENSDEHERQSPEPQQGNTRLMVLLNLGPSISWVLFVKKFRGFLFWKVMFEMLGPFY